MLLFINVGLHTLSACLLSRYLSPLATCQLVNTSRSRVVDKYILCLFQGVVHNLQTRELLISFKYFCISRFCRDFKKMYNIVLSYSERRVRRRVVYPLRCRWDSATPAMKEFLIHPAN